MSGSNEGLSEILDEWEDNFEVFDGWLEGGDDAPLLDMSFFAEGVKFINEILGILLKKLSVDFFELKVLDFLDVFLIPFFL